MSPPGSAAPSLSRSIAPAHERVGEAGDAEVAQLGLQAAAEEAGLGAGRHVEQAVEAVAVRVQRAHGVAHGGGAADVAAGDLAARAAVAVRVQDSGERPAVRLAARVAGLAAAGGVFLGQRAPEAHVRAAVHGLAALGVHPPALVLVGGGAGRGAAVLVHE